MMIEGRGGRGWGEQHGKHNREKICKSIQKNIQDYIGMFCKNYSVKDMICARPCVASAIGLTSQKQLRSPRRDHQTGRNLGLPSLMLPKRQQ